jgi:hypothetical protein
MKTLHKLLLTTTLLLVGCATAPKMNKLSLGMTKPEVISIMGTPDSTSAPVGGVEILNYKLSPKGGPFMNLVTEDYFVKLVSGKVDSYGKGQAVVP